MSFVNILPLISAVFVLFLGLLVLTRNIKSKVNLTFFLHALAITVWLFGTFMMFISKNNYPAAIYWDRFVYGGVAFIVVFMHHFRLALTKKKPDLLLYLGYLLSFFFLIISRTPYFVDSVFVYKWGIHTQARLFHHLFLVYFTTYVIIWFVGMYKYYKSTTSPVIKQQTKYIFIAFLFLFTIGPLAYLPAYGIGIYPFAYVSGVIFAIILAYAIVAHHLMDIKLVARKYVVSLFSIASIVVPAALLKYFLALFFNSFSYWTDLLILAVAVSIYPSLKTYYFRLANKYFFSSLYDTQEVIALLSDKLSSTIKTEEIYQFISQNLLDVFHAKSLGILTYENSGYILKYGVGISLKRHQKLNSDPEMQRTYFNQSSPLIVEELKRTSYNKYKETINLLESLGVEIVVPLEVKNKTIGLIILGAKESGDMYNEEDMLVLKIVGAQTAISMDNALLYEETKNFNIKLKKEIKKATAELESANEKLKELDQAKNDFVSIVSHQMRAPLTVIKGYLSMFLDGTFGEFTPKVKDVMGKVFDSSSRLINLIEDLLNLSRIESGKIQFNFAPKQLRDMVESIIEELTAPAQGKGLKLIYHKTDEILPLVNIDEDKLRQVAFNLTENAVKYTEHGWVEINLRKVDNNIEFCVHDSGIGFKKELLPSLFQKFSRIVNKESQIRGSGLGLYVARMMVEAHHGKIWAESDGEGLGSRFCFTIPIINS